MERSASIHIKPCNVGQSEAHNLRTEAYMKHIKRENVYIRTEMAEKNESWVAPEVNNQTLQDYLDGLAHLVKEKTGRAMQTKVRERVIQKTGRVVKVTGCSALKEGVINCDDNTTMEDLQRFCRLLQKTVYGSHLEWSHSFTSLSGLHVVYIIVYMLLTPWFTSWSRVSLRLRSLGMCCCVNMAKRYLPSSRKKEHRLGWRM